jgi:hypothetical protein
MSQRHEDKLDKLDGGLAAWIKRNIPDSRIRLALLAIIGIVLLASFIRLSFTTVADAFDAMTMVLLAFAVMLFIVVLWVAIFPIRDDADPGSRSGAVFAQKNARVSLIFLVSIVAFGTIVLNFLVRPVWNELEFEYYRFWLKLDRITLADFITAIPADPGGDRLLAGEIIYEPREQPLSWLHENGAVADVSALLRLVTSRSVAEIQGNLVLDRTTTRRAIVAAKKIIFRRGSVVDFGSTEIFFVAHEFVFEDAALVRAFAGTDVLSSAGLDFSKKGRAGAPAGNITFVSLSVPSGNGRLTLDDRGQRGGVGAPGRNGEPGKNGANAIPQPGRPKWKFGPWDASDIEELKRKQQERTLSGDDQQVRTRIEEVIQLCGKSPSSCVGPTCKETEDDWKTLAAGKRGERGEDGGSAGDGGDSGISGRVRVFSLGENYLDIAGKFIWANRAPITDPPPERSGGEPGEPGKGGQGGPGGIGLPADSLGACPSGITGSFGDEGTRGKAGSAGEESHGEKVVLTRLTSF